MKKYIFAGVLLVSGWSTSAMAGSCQDLAAMANSALSMQGLDSETKLQLNELLDAARSGDPAKCDQMTGTIFQSSPEGEKAPARAHRCSKIPESV